MKAPTRTPAWLRVRTSQLSSRSRSRSTRTSPDAASSTARSSARRRTVAWRHAGRSLRLDRLRRHGVHARRGRALDGSVRRSVVAGMGRGGDPWWREWDERWIRGEVATRAAIRGQVAPFTAPDDELIAYAVEHCPLDPTF